MPKEGKSTIASNLAALYAASGTRTVLIDADIRTASISQQFCSLDAIGLLEVLTVNADLENCLIVEEKTGMKILPAGTVRQLPNTSDILGSEKTRALLDRLLETNDLIIVDLPPLKSVADGLAICPMLDGVLLVAEWCETPLEVLAEAAYLVRRAQANVIGALINKVDPSLTQEYR